MQTCSLICEHFLLQSRYLREWKLLPCWIHCIIGKAVLVFFSFKGWCGHLVYLNMTLIYALYNIEGSRVVGYFCFTFSSFCFFVHSTYEKIIVVHYAQDIRTPFNVQKKINYSFNGKPTWMKDHNKTTLFADDRYAKPLIPPLIPGWSGLVGCWSMYAIYFGKI